VITLRGEKTVWKNVESALRFFSDLKGRVTANLPWPLFFQRGEMMLSLAEGKEEEG
jgi:hypothetical protein